MKKALKTAFVIIVMAAAINTKAQKISVWKLSDLKASIDSAKGPTVLNFWATFCKPCIAELPHFQAMADKYKAYGINLIFVSLDVKEAYPKTITAFIKKRKLSSPVVFLDETDADSFVPLVHPSWSGSIPATLFIYAEKNYRKFVEEEFTKAKLEAEIKKMLFEKQ